MPVLLYKREESMKAFPQVVQIPSFYPKGSKIKVIFARRATVSEIQTDFQNCHIWSSPYLGMKLDTGKVVHAVSIQSLRVGDTGQFSKLPYLGIKLGGHW